MVSLCLLAAVFLASCATELSDEVESTQSPISTAPSDPKQTEGIDPMGMLETTPTTRESPQSPTIQNNEDRSSDRMYADVLSVSVRGASGAFQFSVEISSPDLGCEQYADWWEVVDEDGNLIHRRILAHSHVSEQPFTRSGGPVAIEPASIIIIRAHMYPYGYGGAALKGSVQDGFQPIDLAHDFATGLADQPPLPGGCAF